MILLYILGLDVYVHLFDNCIVHCERPAMMSIVGPIAMSIPLIVIVTILVMAMSMLPMPSIICL